MASFTVTINNSIRSLGIGPTSKWGSMVWGSGKWGEGTIPVEYLKFINIGINETVLMNSDIIRIVTKGIFNTQGTTSDLSKNVGKLIANSIGSTSEISEKNPTKVLSNAIGSDSTVSKEPTIVFSNSIAVTEDLDSLKIYDNAGYVDEFPGGIPDGLNRIWDNWTETSGTSDSSSQSSDPSTTWSEL